MNTGDKVVSVVDMQTGGGTFIPKGTKGTADGVYGVDTMHVKLDTGEFFYVPQAAFKVDVPEKKTKKVRNPEDFDLVRREVVYVGPQNQKNSIAHRGVGIVEAVGHLGAVQVEVSYVGTKFWVASEYELAGALRGRGVLHMGDMLEHTDAGGKKELGRLTGLREKGNGDIVVTVLRKDGTEEKFPMGPSDTIKVVHDKRKKGSLKW